MVKNYSSKSNKNFKSVDTVAVTDCLALLKKETIANILAYSKALNVHKTKSGFNIVTVLN